MNKITLKRDAGLIESSSEAAKVVREGFESEGWKNVEVKSVQKTSPAAGYQVWVVTCLADPS